MRSRLLCYTFVGLAVVNLSGWSDALAKTSNPRLNLLDTRTVTGEEVDRIGGLAPGSSALYTGDVVPGYYNGNDLVGYHHFSPADGSVLETGRIVGTEYPAVPTGMARNNGHLFTTAFTDGMFNGIVEFVPGNPATVVDTYQFQGTEPYKRTKGLTHDGRFIWQAHYSPKVGRLYAIDPATGDRVNTLDVDPYPYGLAYDGRYFWVSHHDPDRRISYIAKYDRSENQLATYSLPTSMEESNTALGDLAVTKSGLYAHVLGSNDVAHFSLPAATGNPPALASGVKSASVATAASIGYDGKTVADSQAAANYGQLPIAASVEREATGSAMDVAGLARSHYDKDGIHNEVSAIAYGQDHDSDLQATGTLLISKTILISPSAARRPKGTSIWATGTLTFNGLLQAMRDENEGWPSAKGLAAIFIAKVIKTGPGKDVVCFNGSVSLLGKAGRKWVRVVLAGDANTAALRKESQEDLVITDGLATLELDHFRMGFRIPAVVGRAFDVNIIFHAGAFIPAMAGGVGAEVAFGCPGELGEGYFVVGDPEGYEDGYGGDDWPGWSWGHAPEPSIMLLLLTGGLFTLRRRKRGVN